MYGRTMTGFRGISLINRDDVVAEVSVNQTQQLEPPRRRVVSTRHPAPGRRSSCLGCPNVYEDRRTAEPADGPRFDEVDIHRATVFAHDRFFSQRCDGADANDWTVSLLSGMRMKEASKTNLVTEFDLPVASLNRVQFVADDAPLQRPRFMVIIPVTDF